jgi:hypothetical protein
MRGRRQTSDNKDQNPHRKNSVRSAMPSKKLQRLSMKREYRDRWQWDIAWFTPARHLPGTNASRLSIGAD